MSKRAVTIIAIAWMVLLVAGASSALTLTICGVGGASSGVDLSGEETISVSRSEYELIERYKRLEDIRTIVERDYYQEVEEDTLLTGAARGMLQSVKDPYTFYYTPEEMRSLNEHSGGEYQGVGFQMISGKDNMIQVSRVFSGSPADRAGVRVGDFIVAVGDEVVSGATSKDIDEAIAKIQGDLGSSVKITVKRNGELYEYEMSREKITINRVEYKILDGNIGYLMLYEFMGNDVEGFQQAIEAFKEADVRGMVLDLRSNTGGLLDDVVPIADTLLPKGLIVYTEDRYGRRDERYSDEERYDVPMVVLVNGMSASASEILAGAIQDYGVGELVGTTTYGKGVVQTIIPFRSDGAGMQLTTANYYTPNGRSIHGTGITPDVEVEAEGNPAMGMQADPSSDNQLQRALEELERVIEQKNA